MSPRANSNSNATGLGSGTYSTVVAPFPALAQQGGTPGAASGTDGQSFQCQAIDLATYAIVLNSGVTAGVATFQALLPNGTWYNLASPAPISALVYATAATYNGIINGPFHGLRVVISGLTGGTIAAIEIIGSIRTL